MDTCVCRYMGFFLLGCRIFRLPLEHVGLSGLALKSTSAENLCFEFTVAFIGKMAYVLARIRDSKIGHGLANYKYHNLKSKLLGKYKCKTSLYWPINSHFVLILPCVCLLLTGKCNLHVWVGSFVLCLFQIFSSETLSVECCKWIASVVCTVGFLPWPWQNQFKQWSLTISF